MKKRPNGSSPTLKDEPVGSSSLSALIRAAGRVPLLTKEQELDLGRRVLEDGDLKAQAHLVEANLRLVVSIAKKHAGRMAHSQELDDLIIMGVVGLREAARRYDYRRRCRFSTYATGWIRQRIYRLLLNEGRTIRLPIYIASQLSDFRKELAALEQKLGHSASQTEICQQLGYDSEKVKILLSCGSPIISLDTPTGEDKDDTILELIAVTDAENVEDALMRKVPIDLMLGMLPPLEKRVLRLRFGIDDGVGLTQSEVAAILNVSCQRVMNAEKAAIRKLRAQKDQFFHLIS